MKTKNFVSKVLTLIAFVFVCIFAVSSSNAWLSSNPTKTTFVITYGEVSFQLLGNSTVAGYSDSATDIIADSKTPTNDKGFYLPTTVTSGGTFNQRFAIKNVETSAIYVRVRFTTYLDNSTSSAATASSLTPNTSWTLTAGSGGNYYSATISASTTTNICTQMKVGTISNSTFVRLKLEIEAASSTDKFTNIT